MPTKLATQEVAELLGTTDQHVRKLARDGRIPHYRIGALYRFDPAEVDTYLGAQRRDATGV